jgi:hypothetical protein
MIDPEMCGLVVVLIFDFHVAIGRWVNPDHGVNPIDGLYSFAALRIRLYLGEKKKKKKSNMTTILRIAVYIRFGS